MQELNGNIVISSLNHSQNEIKQHFEHAENLARRLEMIIGDFSAQHKNLSTSLEDETKWLASTKNSLLKFNDVSKIEKDIPDQITKLKVCLSKYFVFILRKLKNFGLRGDFFENAILYKIFIVCLIGKTY